MHRDGEQGALSRMIRDVLLGGRNVVEVIDKGMAQGAIALKK